MPINLEYIFDTPRREGEARRRKEETKRWLARKKLEEDSVPHPPTLRERQKQASQESSYARRLGGFHAQRESWGTAGQRLREVQNISQFQIKTISEEEYDARREAFDRKKYSLLKLRQCFVCKEQAHHRHHLILLKHGGTNIKDNLIGLCEPCHTAVHPWMVAAQKNLELDERLNFILAKE